MQSPVDTRAKAFDVAGAFLNYYFNVETPKDVIANVYGADSAMNVFHAGDAQPTVYSGADAIKQRLVGLPPSAIYIDLFDAQITVADAVVVLFKGREIIGDKSYSFNRTFVLASAGNSYYLKTDIVSFEAPVDSEVIVVAADEVEPTPEVTEAPAKAETVEPVVATEEAPKRTQRKREPRVRNDKAKEKVEKVEQPTEAVPEAEAPAAPQPTEEKPRAAAKPLSWAACVSGTNETEQTAEQTTTEPKTTEKPARAPREPRTAREPREPRRPRENRDNAAAVNTKENKPVEKQFIPGEVYISRIPPTVTAEAIEKALLTFGAAKVDVPANKSFGYAVFTSNEAASAAIKVGSLTLADGVTVQVSGRVAKSSLPRPANKRPASKPAAAPKQ